MKIFEISYIVIDIWSYARQTDVTAYNRIRNNHSNVSIILAVTSLCLADLYILCIIKNCFYVKYSF